MKNPIEVESNIATVESEEVQPELDLKIRRVRVSSKVKAGGPVPGGCRVISAVTWVAPSPN